MNTGFMRKVDYYLGIPLCFFFSLLHMLSRSFLKKDRTVTEPGKILFIKFFGIGTIALAAPAIKRCRELYPEASLYFLTFRENTGILELLNVTAPIEVLSVSPHSITSFIGDTLKTLARLRKERFDVVVDLEFFSRFTAIISFLSRARARIGFYNHHTEGLYRGNFLTHKVFYNHFQHTSLAFLDLVDTIRSRASLPYNKMQYREPLMPEDLGITFEVSQEQRRECVTKFRLTAAERLVLLNPNLSGVFCDLRRWPLDHFASLAQRLLREFPEVRIGIIGVKKDLPTALELSNSIASDRVTVFAGQTSLQELCVLLDCAACLVTNDSGPSHLAAFTNTRSVTLFGPETPLLFAPLSRRAVSMSLNLGCSPCWSIYNGKRSPCRDNQCLKQLTPEMVFREVVKEW